MVEYRTFNPRVEGSNPSGVIFKKEISMVQDRLNTTKAVSKKAIKSYENVFNWELMHPMEQEAFIIGMIYGIFESRYKLYHATRRPGNTVELPGILLSENILSRLEHDYRNQLGRKCRYLFSLIKARMETDPAFKLRHSYMRHFEKMYKNRWESEVD